MGNKDQLSSKTPMWSRIISDLEESDCVGTGWPVGCHHHKDHRYLADRPGIIEVQSPEGR
jgi:hypothetical protein